MQMLAFAPVLGIESLVSIVVVLVVIGLVWWLVDTQLPLPDPIKLVIRVLIVLALCLWLLRWAALI